MSLNLAPNAEKNANQASLPIVSSTSAVAVSVSVANVRDPLKNAASVRASTDVLVQLRANLSQLEELHARLQFSMAEVSYLIRRD